MQTDNGGKKAEHDEEPVGEPKDSTDEGPASAVTLGCKECLLLPEGDRILLPPIRSA